MLGSVSGARIYWTRCVGHEHIGLGVKDTSILGSVSGERAYWVRC